MPDQALAAQVDLDEVTLTGDLAGTNAERAILHDCLVVDADLSDLRAAHSRWIGSTWERVRGSGVDVSSTTWSESRILGARLGALQLYGASLASTRVDGGKIDFLNLRGATLVDVDFVDCVLLEPDFGEAKLTRVTFQGCRLVAADFTKVRAHDVDLTGARLEAPTGLASLKGVTISRLQLIDLADSLASELGIRVV